MKADLFGTHSYTSAVQKIGIHGENGPKMVVRGEHGPHAALVGARRRRSVRAQFAAGHWPPMVGQLWTGCRASKILGISNGAIPRKRRPCWALLGPKTLGIWHQFVCLHLPEVRPIGQGADFGGGGDEVNVNDGFGRRIGQVGAADAASSRFTCAVQVLMGITGRNVLPEGAW